jgi:hypothetical protein
VGSDVEREEEAGVGEGGGRDDRLPCDVDARESEAGEDPDPDEVEELAVPCAEGQRMR